MLNPIDYLLNRITMYRLVLYYLTALFIVALVFSFFGVLPFSALNLFVSWVYLVAACWIANTVFAKIFKAQTNIESVYISAFILTLILTPFKIPHDIVFLGWAAMWTIASKYIFALHKKHIFNPAAFGVWFTGLGLMQYASWWVGTLSMLPFVVVGGFLVVRKIQREDLVFSFLATALVVIGLFDVLKGYDLALSIQKTITDTPLFFFAFIMLTEPLTTPPTKKLQTIYGVLVGILFSPQISIAGTATTPESALLLGNIFSYLVSPKSKLFLTLQEKIHLADDLFDFVFPRPKDFLFTPGQYMEWTLSHKNSDSRGNRRYFTLASSPTEDTVQIGVKFYPNSSSFKKALQSLDMSQEIVAAQLAGDFTLPEDTSKKLVFVAGGIGITPYRSMVKYLLDKQEKRTVTLFYAAKTPDEFAYADIFNQATEEIGLQVIYTVTDKENQYPDWKGHIGRVTPDIISQNVPDYKERLFYLSGPIEMVNGFKETLKQMGVSSGNIKTDFFPGYA